MIENLVNEKKKVLKIGVFRAIAWLSVTQFIHIIGPEEEITILPSHCS